MTTLSPPEGAMPMAPAITRLPSLTHLLPECSIKTLAQYGTHSTQTPDGMMAIHALSAVATAINGKIEIGRRDGSVDKAQYYFLSIGSPGDGQSHCLSIAAAPILAWQKERLRRYKIEWPEGTKNPPPQPRVYFGDVTPTAIIRALSQHNGVLSHHSAEGILLDLFTRWPSLVDLFCGAFVGEEIILDRANKQPICLENPAISLSVMAKLETILKFLRNKYARDRGLCGRALMMNFPSIAGHRNVDVPPIPKSSTDEFNGVILSLLEMPSPPPGGRHRITTDSAGDRIYIDYKQYIEDQLLPGGRFSFDAYWCKKYTAKVLQIAALLHCIKFPDPLVRLVDSETICQSIAMAELFAAHARDLFFQADYGMTTDIAREIEAWAVRRSYGGFSFSVEDARHALSRYSTKEIHAGVSLLLQLRRIYEDYLAYQDQHQHPSRRGRNLAPRYRLTHQSGGIQL